ncbi:hypothetical protein [Polaribacter aquimarinus]|uniref:hypothetical protein n=1 Tax=Polaribacter aquimarinus TaxID=2100726 RepID=UPI0015E7F68A|nr:hypothetical protein [Polaribacter aquimarinus]
MKKLILAVVFVFATGTIMNANSFRIIAFQDCTQDAWDYGTEAGDGDPVAEYEYTNQYFELHCNEDGTYKKKLTINNLQ